MIGFPLFLLDNWQRQVLFFDALCRRGNAWFAQQGSQQETSLLCFQTERLLDGRVLTPPTNYLLDRVIPSQGMLLDEAKRPFIIFDPRAGHGPGMSGMKPDSEIGMALAQAHPVYYVSYCKYPVPGQTVVDVCEAEAAFVKEVAKRHPKAPKPCLIGNCQAGWQIAMMSARYPDLAGALILAASPLAYRRGNRGENHMRYVSAMTGGAWAVAMACDLAGGVFDGAHLVDGFEKNTPDHAYWGKYTHLFRHIDTEVDRFLAFECWWNEPFFLSREEMVFIARELFIGDYLVRGRVSYRNGERVDLRAIRAPLVVFCSTADDITPPPQALGWLLDLYEDENQLATAGRTVVYVLHEKVGHLGIFVSSSVAVREHKDLVAHLDDITQLPPGLYEAVIERESGASQVRFESRSFSVLREMEAEGCTEDYARFERVAQASESLLAVYETYWAPWVRMMAAFTAPAVIAAHPVRLRTLAFSAFNPWLMSASLLAPLVRTLRVHVPQDDPFWQAQGQAVDQMAAVIQAMNRAKNNLVEALFLAMYRPL